MIAAHYRTRCTAITQNSLSGYASKDVRALMKLAASISGIVRAAP